MKNYKNLQNLIQGITFSILTFVWLVVLREYFNLSLFWNIVIVLNLVMYAYIGFENYTVFKKLTEKKKNGDNKSNIRKANNKAEEQRGYRELREKGKIHF